MGYLPGSVRAGRNSTGHSGQGTRGQRREDSLYAVETIERKGLLRLSTADPATAPPGSLAIAHFVSRGLRESHAEAN